MIMTATGVSGFERGTNEHHPVMIAETIGLLAIEPDGIYVDATCGPGGHAEAIAARLSSSGRLIALDRDRRILEAAKRRLSPYPCRIQVVHANFRCLKTVLEEHDINGVNGILFDCGVSMVQLRRPERGFSFREDGPLDMRMDENDGLTAADIINTWTSEHLAKIFHEYGEERSARRIARRIVRERMRTPITTTKQLADLVLRAVGSSGRRRRIHPATKVFQALRIAVNDELSAIEEALSAARDGLAPGGRMAVISFHSLEDRIVKNRFKEWSRSALGRILTPKPVRPSADEVARNPASRSARLRGWEKSTPADRAGQTAVEGESAPCRL